MLILPFFLMALAKPSQPWHLQLGSFLSFQVGKSTRKINLAFFPLLCFFQVEKLFRALGKRTSYLLCISSSPYHHPCHVQQMILLFSSRQVVLQLHVFLHPTGCSEGAGGGCSVVIAAVSNYCHIRRQRDKLPAACGPLWEPQGAWLSGCCDWWDLIVWLVTWE